MPSGPVSAGRPPTRTGIGLVDAGTDVLTCAAGAPALLVFLCEMRYAATIEITARVIAAIGATGTEPRRVRNRLPRRSCAGGESTRSAPPVIRFPSLHAEPWRQCT